MRWSAIVLLAGILASPSVTTASEVANVRLEWRPLQANVVVGDTIDIDLYAVSTLSTSVPICGMQVILDWDATILDGLTFINPCSSGPCPPNAYDWLISDFPNTPNETLNDSLSDGDAYFYAYASLGCPTVSAAVVTPDGLHVATFRFTVMDAGTGQLRFASHAEGLDTKLLDQNNMPALPEFGPPAELHVIDCPPPLVTAVGSRYISIIPAPNDLPVALSVTGDAADDEVSCVDGYVQRTGSIGDIQVAQLPAVWDEIFVSDTEIIPFTSYTVRAHCGLTMGLDLESEPVTVTTWRWGDVNGDGAVNIEDISVVFDGSSGVFLGTSIPQNMDLSPCVADGMIDSSDVDQVQSALGGALYPCVGPCLASPDLEYFAALIDCMSGPDQPLAVECGVYDGNSDAVIDLRDIANFLAVNYMIGQIGLGSMTR